MSTRHTPLVLFALLAPVFIAGCSENSPPEPKVGPKGPLAEANELISAGTAVMVDVRSQEERDAGHLEGSIFLPITQIKEAAGNEGFGDWAAGKIPKGKIVYLH